MSEPVSPELTAAAARILTVMSRRFLPGASHHQAVEPSLNDVLTSNLQDRIAGTVDPWAMVHLPAIKQKHAEATKSRLELEGKIELAASMVEQAYPALAFWVGDGNSSVEGKAQILRAIDIEVSRVFPLLSNNLRHPDSEPELLKTRDQYGHTADKTLTAVRRTAVEMLLSVDPESRRDALSDLVSWSEAFSNQVREASSEEYEEVTEKEQRLSEVATYCEACWEHMAPADTTLRDISKTMASLSIEPGRRLRTERNGQTSAFERRAAL